MTGVIGLTWGEVKNLRGKVDLGVNGTGVVNTSIHFTGDEIILHDEMPGHHVQSIIDHVAAMGDRQKTKRPGGDYVGSIPLPLWMTWRKEWKNGPRKHGVKWRKFFTAKFMDSDHAKFRAGKL